MEPLKPCCELPVCLMTLSFYDVVKTAEAEFRTTTKEEAWNRTYEKYSEAFKAAENFTAERQAGNEDLGSGSPYEYTKALSLISSAYTEAYASRWDRNRDLNGSPAEVLRKLRKQYKEENRDPGE